MKFQSLIHDIPNAGADGCCRIMVKIDLSVEVNEMFNKFKICEFHKDSIVGHMMESGVDQPLSIAN